MMSKECKILIFVLILTQLCDASATQGTSRSRLVTSSKATEDRDTLDVNVAVDGVGDKVGKWLKDRNTEAVKIFRDVADAEWRFYTNMTENNRNTLVSGALSIIYFFPDYFKVSHLVHRVESALSQQ